MAFDVHDYKYAELLAVKGSPMEELVASMNLRTKFLVPVAEAFATNLERTETFAIMPSQIAFRVRRDQLWFDCAEIELLGKLDPDFYKFLEESPGGLTEVVVRIKREFDASRPDKREQFQVGANIGIRYVQELLKTTKAMRHSMEAVLSSLIVSYWAAFESLAPDLWRVSVNHGPAILAQRVNLASLDKADAKIAEHWKDKLQHDPGQDYAGSLIETGRVSFRRLDKIVYWYAVIFESDARQIFKDNRDINALAAYRNALVHNSGKVDKDFIKQVEAVPDLRGKFKENQELPLDGELVSRLRDAVAAIGQQLIQLADNQLSPQLP